jgi:hypothetical protein
MRTTSILLASFVSLRTRAKKERASAVLWINMTPGLNTATPCDHNRRCTSTAVEACTSRKCRYITQAAQRGRSLQGGRPMKLGEEDVHVQCNAASS